MKKNKSSILIIGLLSLSSSIASAQQASTSRAVDSSSTTQAGGGINIVPQSDGGLLIKPYVPERLSNKESREVGQDIESRLFKQTSYLSSTYSSAESPKVIRAGTQATLGLKDLMAENLKDDDKQKELENVSAIRAEAIAQAAASLGARAGFAKILNDYAKIIESKSDMLDVYFNFSKLALAIPINPNEAATFSTNLARNGDSVMIMPPILLDALDEDSFPSEDEMRIADRVYKVFQKERLIPVDKKTGFPVMPNWREYLSFSIQEVKQPHETLKPKNAGERRIWNEWLVKGWKEGELQAARVYENSYARLERDFKGMLTWREAYAEGKATRPVVSSLRLGVTGNGENLRLNDRVYRITDRSALISDPSKWGVKENESNFTEKN